MTFGVFCFPTFLILEFTMRLPNILGIFFGPNLPPVEPAETIRIGREVFSADPEEYFGMAFQFSTNEQRHYRWLKDERVPLWKRQTGRSPQYLEARRRQRVAPIHREPASV
jgi:hypothetical protein